MIGALLTWRMVTSAGRLYHVCKLWVAAMCWLSGRFYVLVLFILVSVSVQAGLLWLFYSVASSSAVSTSALLLVPDPRSSSPCSSPSCFSSGITASAFVLSVFVGFSCSCKSLFHVNFAVPFVMSPLRQLWSLFPLLPWVSSRASGWQSIKRWKLFHFWCLCFPDFSHRL